MQEKIVLLKGDGIGPEIVDQAVSVLQAVAAKYHHGFVFNPQLLGGASIDAYGVPLTDEALSACNTADAVLMGAVGGPKWDSIEPACRPEKGLLALRKGMGVFANLRPCTIHRQLAAACPLRPDIVSEPIDILMLRELTGDIYFGKRHRSEDRAYATDEMAYSKQEISRLARIGFENAMKRKRRLCSVDKANVLECSRLWRETVQEMAKEYPQVEVTYMYVDNAAMQLILRPAQFDVMITGNLFGDILSDESAAIAGSLGMMPSRQPGRGHARAVRAHSRLRARHCGQGHRQPAGHDPLCGDAAAPFPRPGGRGGGGRGGGRKGARRGLPHRRHLVRGLRKGWLQADGRAGREGDLKLSNRTQER